MNKYQYMHILIIPMNTYKYIHILIIPINTYKYMHILTIFFWNIDLGVEVFFGTLTWAYSLEH